MTLPRRTIARFWPPCAAAALVPTVLAVVFPGLASSAAGRLALGAAALAASAGAALLLARRLSADIERVSDDIEYASKQGFREYVRQGEWGLLGDLAAAFDWLLQEVQGSLRSVEFQLTEERARVAALVRTVPDGILLANLRGEVLHANSAAIEMLGLSADAAQPSGAGLHELVRNDALRRSISRLMEKRSRRDVVELQVDGKAGRETRYFESTATLFTSSEEQDIGVMILLRDVSAQRELERVKDDFFHAVAHDLRAPLFGIQGYVRMLEKSASLGEKEKGFVAQVYLACDRLTQLVSDILELARLESGQPAVARDPLDVSALVERVRSMFQAAADEKGLRLGVLGVERAGLVQGDEKLLERALQNLVFNAVKFTPQGGRVTIECAAGESEVELAVRDTGPGIPAQSLGAVFEKFRQLERGATKSGFGLGLTIAKQVVLAHKGTIWAESDPEGGARFAFKIPR